MKSRFFNLSSETMQPNFSYIFGRCKTNKSFSVLSVGGPFALYSLLCRHAKLSMLPNQQAADEELSSYYRNGFTARNGSSPWPRRFMEKHKKVRTVFLLIVLCGASMVIGDGVLTPAISGRHYHNNLHIYHSWNVFTISVGFSCLFFPCSSIVYVWITSSSYWFVGW
jgi:hypothetical protein